MSDDKRLAMATVYAGALMARVNLGPSDRVGFARTAVKDFNNLMRDPALRMGREDIPAGESHE